MIELKSAREIGLMRRAGHILSGVMDRLRTTVKPGMSTLDIDEDVEEFIRAHGARPAFKGYRGFPATVCISINEEVVHGIPSAHRHVQEGDIVGLDLGCIVDGYYADCAFTLAVGDVPPRVQELLNVTRESLERTLRYVETVSAPLLQARPSGSDAALLVEEFGWVRDVLRFACRLGIARVGLSDVDDLRLLPAVRRMELAVEFGQLMERQRDIWLKRNRPGGLSDSLARLEGVLKTLANP